MKKIITVLSILMFTTFAVFAQADLQPLAIVKLNKNESITLKQLKTRCGAYEKQIGRALSVDERKQVLDTMIEETLMVQAAVKAGLNVPDSSVDQYFSQSMSQSLGVSVTEKELDDIIKKQQGKTLDEVLIEQTGMNKVDYKKHLKNVLLMQQYVVQKNQAEIQKVAATDEEIRMAYETFILSALEAFGITGIPRCSKYRSSICALDLPYFWAYAFTLLSPSTLPLPSGLQACGSMFSFFKYSKVYSCIYPT